jgi:hypothetical protein
VNIVSCSATPNLPKSTSKVCVLAAGPAKLTVTGSFAAVFTVPVTPSSDSMLPACAPVSGSSTTLKSTLTGVAGATVTPGSFEATLSVQVLLVPASLVQLSWRSCGAPTASKICTWVGAKSMSVVAVLVSSVASGLAGRLAL